MKTIGELLKAARHRKNLTVSEVADRTKIQEKFIRALENDNYDELPESAFVKGFVRNYAQVVGKDPKMLLAVFRRDYSEDAKGKVVPRGLTEPLNQSRLRWTPRVTAIASFALVIFLVMIYLIFQFRLLSGGPELVVKNPAENAVVENIVSVEGTTNSQATIMVNSKPVAVTSQGAFSETISLSPGEHTIIIEATDRSGHATIVQRTVVVRE